MLTNDVISFEQWGPVLLCSHINELVKKESLSVLDISSEKYFVCMNLSALLVY